MSTLIGPVTTVEVVPRLAAVMRRTVGFAGMPEAQRRARTVVDAAVRAAGVALHGPWLTIWRRLDDGRIDYAPGRLIPEPIAEAGEVSLFTLPAGRAAHLTLTGSFAALPQAWETLFAARGEGGSAGLNWEIYADAELGPDRARTELFALLV